MEKIVVIGSAGAGKSTFAQKLGSILKINVIHLDRYFWQPHWKEKPRDTRIEIQQHLVQEERWIIEGTYLSSSDSRLNAADTFIFLDMPRLLCLWRVFRRRFEYARKARPDLAEGSPEQLSIPYILKILVFPHRGRKILLQKFRYFAPEKIVWLHSKKEVSDFLQKYRTPCEGQAAQAIQVSQTRQEVQLDWSPLMPAFFGVYSGIGCGQ